VWLAVEVRVVVAGLYDPTYKICYRHYLSLNSQLRKKFGLRDIIMPQILLLREAAHGGHTEDKKSRASKGENE